MKKETIKFQFTMNKGEWDEFKLTIPRNKTLEQGIVDALIAHTISQSTKPLSKRDKKNNRVGIGEKPEVNLSSKKRGRRNSSPNHNQK